MSKIINLENISVIKIEENKTIVNFMNAIKIGENKTPDYLYLKDDFSISKLVESLYINKNFLFTNGNTILVNKNSINSINTKEDKLTIILNLNYSITANNQEIANSVFWKFENKEDYTEGLNYIYSRLNNNNFFLEI